MGLHVGNFGSTVSTRARRWFVLQSSAQPVHKECDKQKISRLDRRLQIPVLPRSGSSLSSTMQLQSLLAVLLLLLPLNAADIRPRAPIPRSYDTHSYYALELASSSTAATALSVAESLGVELVEPIGQLDNHWLVRVPGASPKHKLSTRSSGSSPSDAVVERWHALRSRSKRDAKRQLRSITPLTLKQRSKRVPPGWKSSPARLRRDSAELSYAQTQLNLMDPMLQTQWHLINQEDSSNELNVTGLWGRGITGTGVKVVIVDDGLDLNSDDLAANFVSEASDNA